MAKKSYNEIQRYINDSIVSIIERLLKEYKF